MFDGVINFLFKFNILPHLKYRLIDEISLATKVDILLIDALCGCRVDIEHLDGRKLFYIIDNVIDHNTKIKINGEGIIKNFGDLYIEFNIIYPKRIVNKEVVQFFLRNAIYDRN